MQAITLIICISTAYSRFEQQNPPAEKAAFLAVGGSISGTVPNSLLGSTEPCVKLMVADTIASAKPGDKAALEAAMDVVATESNFNPFIAGSLPKFCNDTSLPKTPELRGILSLVSDQDLPTPFGGSGGLTADAINAIAKASRKSPLPADGKSVAQLYLEQGFKDFKDSAALPAAGSAQPGELSTEPSPSTAGSSKPCSELVPLNSSDPTESSDSNNPSESGAESTDHSSDAGSNTSDEPCNELVPLPEDEADEKHSSKKPGDDQDAAVVTVTVTVNSCKPTASPY